MINKGSQISKDETVKLNEMKLLKMLREMNPVPDKYDNNFYYKVIKKLKGVEDIALDDYGAIEYEISRNSKDNTVHNDTEIAYDKSAGDDEMDLEKYLDITNQNLRDIETRITEERPLSEERMEARYNETEKRMQNLLIKVKKKF